jgi:hypothetical protein
MDQGGGKQRGRTAATTKMMGPNPTHPSLPINQRTEANRSGPGKHMNKHRGDRRDMGSTSY